MEDEQGVTNSGSSGKRLEDGDGGMEYSGYSEIGWEGGLSIKPYSISVERPTSI
jgi:hypothetical protein